MVQTFSHAQIKATMVSVLVITVALFQRRHNARCTTLEWLERSSMQFKLSTLMRSESQSEKGSVTVRVDGDTRQRSTSDASPRLRHPAYPPIPVETRFRAGASQTLIEDWHIRSLVLKFPLKNEFAKPCLAQSECCPK